MKKIKDGEKSITLVGQVTMSETKRQALMKISLDVAGNSLSSAMGVLCLALGEKEFLDLLEEATKMTLQTYRKHKDLFEGEGGKNGN